MLRAVRRSWFAYDFDLFDPAGTLATADLSDWRDNAEFEVSGRRYLARIPGTIRLSCRRSFSAIG